MQVCVVAGTFHPEPGGPPTYLMHLLPALAERGHAIEVVTYTDAPRSFCDTTTYGYPVWRTSRRYPIPLRLALITLRVWQRARQADLIFVSDYGLPAALANLALRKPLVLKNVSDFAWEFSTRRGWLPPRLTIDRFQKQHHNWRVRTVQRLQTWYATTARLIIAPSHYSASLITGWGIPAERLRVIYNALDLDLFANLPPKVDVRTELGLGSAPTLIAVGRLVPWKRIDQIIAAVAHVQTQFPTIQLIIIGDGPERAKLEAAAAALGKAVYFTGVLKPETVYRYLRAADLYLQFSTYEGLPHTVLEAMAAGTPVITSDIGGNPEVVETGKTGLMVPAGAVKLLADAICRLLNTPAEAAQLAANATERLGRFSWPQLVESTEAVFTEAVFTEAVVTGAVGHETADKS